MNWRTIFGFLDPNLYYSKEKYSIEDFPLSEKAILIFEEMKDGSNKLEVKTGDVIKSGQRLSINKEGVGFCSSVTGKIINIYDLNWIEGKIFKAIEIETTEDDWKVSADEPNFEKQKPEELIDQLKLLGFDLSQLSLNFDTIILNLLESDLLVSINSELLTEKCDNIKTGIKLIKHITNAKRVIIAVTNNLVETAKNAAQGNAEISIIDPIYPNGANKVLAQILSKKIGNMGNHFIFNAEYLNAMVEAVSSGRPYVEKVITLISSGNKTLKNMRVRVGTPIAKILEANNIKVEKNDKLILGGPMRGKTSYTTDFPVVTDTDSIFIQSCDEITTISDSPCISCGKCVDVCPYNLPVNLISRYSEFSIFEKCEELDIDSCIECGLCSYVCIAKRPLVQFIQFAKNEIKKLKEEEEE